MDVEVADEPACGAEYPSAAGGGVVLIEPLPGELRTGGAVACAVSDVEGALHRDEHDLAVGGAIEGDMGPSPCRELVVPVVHLDDAPAAGEDLCGGWVLGHQPVSARRRGRHTRL